MAESEKGKWEGWIVTMNVRPYNAYYDRPEVPNYTVSRQVQPGEDLIKVMAEIRYGILIAAGEELIGRG